MKRPVLAMMLLISIVKVYGFQSPVMEKSKKQTVSAANELIQFVKIANDANNPEDIDKNIDWLTEAFTKRGFDTKVLPTAKTPLFFAEKKAKGALSTLLFYMHFDGQSVDPSKWDQGDPYIAEIKEKKSGEWQTIAKKLEANYDPEWRIFGRSTSDDKGPIVMLLNAIDIMQSEKMDLGYNIKVVLDGEEEKGSSHLAAAVEQYKEILSADHFIINDGPMHLSGKPTVIFGCRGNTGLVLTVYGPRTHQHSGHYGNYAPNPVFRLSQLLASMKDEEGRVIIPGYYDGITLDQKTREVLNSVPDNIEQIHSIIGIAEPEKVGNTYQESLQYPSLNVRGMAAAWVGPETRTIVPESATASIDIRLVPESDPDRLKGLVISHIEKQGYYIIDREPTDEERMSHPKIIKITSGGATSPFRTDLDSPTGKIITSSIEKGFGESPVKIRIMGGTVPTADFINTLNVPALIVPLVNADNNQHSPNENLRVGNITTGIATFISILTDSKQKIKKR